MDFGDRIVPDANERLVPEQRLVAGVSFEHFP